MKSSCISWPEHEPLVLIRASQVHICEGNHCAAALLSYFEYWHTVRLEQLEQAEHHNKVAALHGEAGMQDTSLLQYHTEQKIEEGLLRLYARSTIRRGIALLVEKGFLSLHMNPNPRFYFDRTHYFLFHPDVVQAEIRATTHDVKVTDAEGKNNASSETQKNAEIGATAHDVKVTDRGRKNNASSETPNTAEIGATAHDVKVTDRGRKNNARGRKNNASLEEITSSEITFGDLNPPPLPPALTPGRAGLDVERDAPADPALGHEDAQSTENGLADVGSTDSGLSEVGQSATPYAGLNREVMKPTPTPPLARRREGLDVESAQRCDDAFREKPPATTYTPGFLRAWHSWPMGRKQGKSVMWRIWCERGLEPRAAEIVEKIDRLNWAIWSQREPRYTPTPRTWFEEARYEDDLVPLEVAQTQDLAPRMSYVEAQRAREAEAQQRFLGAHDGRSRRQRDVLERDDTVIDGVEYRIDG